MHRTFIGCGRCDRDVPGSGELESFEPAARFRRGPETKAVLSENTSNTSIGPTFQQRYPRYKLEFGDQFDVSFELSPEFNQTVTVQPDGYITLRGAGDVHVVGQTVPQLTETLKQAYSKILKDPVISVVLKDFEKPYFIADGQVGKPGKYELRGETTLTQGIAIAGGFQDSCQTFPGIAVPPCR